MRKLLLLFLLFAIGTVGTIAQTPRLVTLPADHQITPGSWQSLAISPDGSRIVYPANSRLFLRPLAGVSTEIAGSAAMQGLTMPVFSPDGGSIAYWSQADQTLRRIPVTGGTSTVITKSDNPTGMTWAGDQIVFAQGPRGILRVPAAGGTPEVVVAAANGEQIAGPQLLPNNAILFTTITPRQGMPPLAQIVAQSAGSTERRVLVEAIAEGHYVPSGHLVYAVNGDLFALKFDLARLATTGQPVRVAQDIRTLNVGQLAVSANGTLVSIQGARGAFDITAVDKTGRRQVLGQLPDSVFAPRVSPDGKRLAIDDQGGIWVGELNNLAGLKQVIAGGQATGVNQFPLWDETGNRLYFISTRDGGTQSLFVQSADGSGQAELLARPARAPEGWSLENGFLTYISLTGTSDYGIWRYSLRDKTLAPYLERLNTAELSTKFSHDGKWVAFMTNETGQFEIYVQALEDPSTRIRISTNGGKIPTWSPDDREIYFNDPSGSQMNVVSIQIAGNRITAGMPQRLPISGFIQRGTIYARRQYDLLPDGRFLMMFQPAVQVGVVANWGEQLRQRLP